MKYKDGISKVLTFRPDKIKLISLRRRSQIGRGAAIGASVGVAGGAVGGAVAEPGFLGRGFNMVFGSILGGVS